MSNLSEADKAKLTQEQQNQIQELKEQWAQANAAGDTEAMNAAHAAAEQIRNEAGYSGGADGSGYVPVDAGSGGKTAAQIREEMEAFDQTYYKPGIGWVNGYSTAMNTRSKANAIRQQMDANSKAWHTADEGTKKYLHEQNMELAQVLYDYTGQSDSTNYFNEATGRWETWNSDLGYGYDMNSTRDHTRNAWKNFYGYTDEQIENWAKDTSHYYNFVDTRAPARNTIDESVGYTGQYAQFVNGPYASLMGGTRGKNLAKFTDVIGDGFGDEGTFTADLRYDMNGRVIKKIPELKNNNDMTLYSAQFAPAAVNGVLTGKGATASLSTAADPNNAAGQGAYYSRYGSNGSNSYISGGTYEDYLQQLYGSALASQLKALESGYAANLAELDSGQKEIDALYTEQKRQTSGESARQSAAWREMANAYGLNSGAVGQASLAQRNQLQSDLNKLNAAQASARTELQRQRLLLGQQYQLAIQEAIAGNQSELAKSLYEEAVRAEEALRQQEQYYANLALQYSKALMSFMKSMS